MAINNWRYVVTWGYRNPDGTIIEERQRVPSQTVVANDGLPHFHTQSAEFSPAETYRLRADGYYNQGDNALGDAFWTMADEMWKYSSYANSTIKWYEALLNYLRWNEAWLQDAAWKLYNELAWWIQNDYDYVDRMFWPNGELTREVNTYYDDLWNYLATDAGRQAATIAAQWLHSWASLWAIRAQQNQAYNESFARYVQAKEQQINAKQEIATNLMKYMSTLRTEYWDTTNKYIIEMYKRANDLYNQTVASLVKDLNQFNALWASWSWWSSSSLLESLWLTPRGDWTYTDSNGNVYDAKWNKVEGKWISTSEAKSELGKMAPWDKASNVDYVGNWLKYNPAYIMGYEYPKLIWDGVKNIYNWLKD